MCQLNYKVLVCPYFIFLLFDSFYAFNSLNMPNTPSIMAWIGHWRILAYNLTRKYGMCVLVYEHNIKIHFEVYAKCNFI